MSDAPDPLVPSDVDLRGYDYMPLYGERLFKSETWINATDTAKVASLRIWWQAWAHEVPAASLPNNDKLLAEYAGYGLSVRAWLRIKPQVMPGFIECNDGRLYHDQLSIWAIEAWDRRVKERQRKANWRNAKEQGRPGDKDRDETGTGQGRPRSVPSEGKVSEVKRSEANKFKSASVVSQPSEALPPKVNGAVENTGSTSKATTPGQDWGNRAWVYATAQTVGKVQHPGEEFDAFKDRVYGAVQANLARAKSDHGKRA